MKSTLYLTAAIGEVGKLGTKLLGTTTAYRSDVYSRITERVANDSCEHHFATMSLST